MFGADGGKLKMNGFGFDNGECQYFGDVVLFCFRQRCTPAITKWFELEMFILPLHCVVFKMKIFFLSFFVVVLITDQWASTSSKTNMTALVFVVYNS